jgi:hypothetical protein
VRGFEECDFTELWEQVKGLRTGIGTPIKARCAKTVARPVVTRSTSAMLKCCKRSRLSDHAERTRHRVSDGPQASVAALAAAACGAESQAHVVQAVRNFSTTTALRFATRRSLRRPRVKEQRRCSKSTTSTARRRI